LKKLLLLALIVAIGWKYYLKPIDVSKPALAESIQMQKSESVRYTSEPSFSCDGRQHCSQMSSRAEAVYFINHCPNTKMDGDHD
jgi:hypothetical protein